MQRKSSDYSFIPSPDGIPITVPLAGLENPCKVCGGAGFEEAPEWTAWKAENAGRLREARDSMPDVPERITCKGCSGKGTVLTDVGEKYVAFIRRHLNG